MIHPFSVTKHPDGEGVVRLAVVGQIDEDVSEALATIIANAAGQHGVRQVVVDLHGVSFLAAAGIRALLVGRLEAQGHGCSYRVVNAAAGVERVLRATGVAAILELAPWHATYARD